MDPLLERTDPVRMNPGRTCNKGKRTHCRSSESQISNKSYTLPLSHTGNPPPLLGKKNRKWRNSGRVLPRNL